MESVQRVMWQCAFVIALFACHGIISVQGRPLRPMTKSLSFHKKIGAANSETETTNKVSQTILSNDKDTPPSSNHFGVEIEKSSENSAVVVNIDAFRPTTPGTSPGVGHPRSISNDSGLVERNNQSNGERHFVTGNKDDFRPTAPGHSPGVGHSVGNN
ncbi:hypothetical protein TorRG33x02_017590 [Trema orientale]|uniref:Encoded peptide n=1 Tax=Trema orientale TaxID=63057 RepID=A0A2P5FYA0_TREOI|nr:hypothetical protein TorRG33x02_017590 [Trema orientale]